MFDIRHWKIYSKKNFGKLTKNFGTQIVNLMS